MGEKEYLKQVGPDGVVRIRYRIETDRGRLRHVVVQLEVREQDRWHVVVRYDNAHQVLHRDELDASGRETKTTVQLPTLEMFVAYAEQDLADRWEWYCERFLARLRRRSR
jgi:hypothetical protein